MDSEVNIPEPGTIVLAKVEITAALAEKSTVEGVAVFADAWTVEAAEKGLKQYLEEQLLRDGILAEITAKVEGVSTEAEDFDTSEEDVDDEDEADETEEDYGDYLTDSDPGDETEEPGPRCGACDCATDECVALDGPSYITLQLTPAEAAAVRIVTGNISGDGSLQEHTVAVRNALEEVAEPALDDVLAAYEGHLAVADTAAFNRVVSAYEQALKQKSDLEPIQQLCYTGSRPVTRRVM